MSASPMGVPGWPLLAFSTASIERPLMVLTASWICWGLYSRGMANLLQQDRVDRDSLELCVAARLAREGEKEQKDREDQEGGGGSELRSVQRQHSLDRLKPKRGSGLRPSRPCGTRSRWSSPGR